MFSTRRGFVAGSLATGAYGFGLGHAAAKEELKLSTFVPPTHVIVAKVLTPWMQEVAKISSGELTARLFPSMQLGGKPPELYRQMTRGISDICFTVPGYTSSDFPMLTLGELPGMATSADDGTKKLWAHFDKHLAGDFTEAKVLMLWNSDSAALMSKAKPIRTLEDMRGLKIRTPSAAQSAQLTALGATPIDMPANQIYNALDRGVVDAAMIPMSAAIDFKLIEVAKYFTLDAPLGRSSFLVAMNKARYDKLPPNLKKVIDDTTGLKLSLEGAKTYDEQNHEGVAAAKQKAEIVTLTAAERARWIAAFKPLIEQTASDTEKAGYGARAMLKSYGLLG